MIVPTHIADRLLAECFGRPRAYQELGRLCDTVGGRVAGTEAAARGEEWGAGLMRAWGVPSVAFEEFPIRAWSRISLDARVTGPSGWALTAVSHGLTPEAADAEGPVVDIGHGDPEEFAAHAASLPGAMVFCDEGAGAGRRKLHRMEKLALAQEYGASGMVMISSASGMLPRTGGCHRQGADIPAIGIAREDGLRIQRLLAAGDTVRLAVSMRNRLWDGSARNVIGEIPGSDLPQEVVIAGAHLDSWDVAQGATDNGLGCAIVLEMARALAALGERPRRTLRFALWGAEETGIHGSRTHVERRADELDRIAGVMNFDMTGDPYGYWTPGRTEPGPMLRGLAEQLAPLGMQPDFSNGAGLHSDHQYFMLEGVPVVCLAARLEGEGGRYYHAAGDTFDKVSQSALCRAAAVGAHTLWALADAPERPFGRLDTVQVRAMLEEAKLIEALRAEGYAGPAVA